jgi:hypothetical protein
VHVRAAKHQISEIGETSTPETLYSEKILDRHSSAEGMFKDQRLPLQVVEPRNKIVSCRDD